MKTLASPPLRNAFALILMVAIISLCYGLQYRVGAGEVFSYYLGFSAAFAIILAFATYGLLHHNTAPVRLSAAHGWCGFALMLASFGLTLFFQSKLLAPVPWYALAASAALVGWYVHQKWSAKASTRFFALLAIAFVALQIARTGIWQKGDMLTSIEAASKEFLAGKQPYRPYPEIYLSLAKHQSFEVQDPVAFASRYQIAHRPFYYLPGIWLPYVPAVALGIDLRILNLLFVACLILVFERYLAIRCDRSVALSLTFYPLLLSPSFLGILSALHVVHYWLLLLLTMLCIHEKHYWLASLCLGLTLATRQPALFVAVPLFAWLSFRLRWIDLLRYGLATLSVYLIVMLPFAIWWGDIGMFWKHHYIDVASLPGTNDLRRDIGLANLMDLTRLPWAGAAIELAIVLFASVHIVIRGRGGLSWMLQFLGVTYLWVILFNTYSPRYVYYPGFLLSLAGLAMALGGIHAREELGPSRFSGSPSAGTSGASNKVA